MAEYEVALTWRRFVEADSAEEAEEMVRAEVESTTDDYDDVDVIGGQ